MGGAVGVRAGVICLSTTRVIHGAVLNHLPLTKYREAEQPHGRLRRIWVARYAHSRFALPATALSSAEEARPFSHLPAARPDDGYA
jgi:hypothetical protein